MSLPTISPAANIRQLYGYKLRAYSHFYTSLIMVQILAFLFSLNGINQVGTMYEAITITVHTISTNLILIFSMIWAFMTAIIITTKPYRETDFFLVANGFTSHLANVLFLLTASFVSAALAILCGPPLKLAAVYLLDYDVMAHTVLSFRQLLLGVVTAGLYLFLVSMVGFLVGTLVLWHKAFTLFLPALFVALLFVPTEVRDGGSITQQPALIEMFRLFISESSFPVFVGKVAVAILLLYLATLFLATRLEVKQSR